MNKFQFLGRLTKDPETRIMEKSGNKVTNFTLAGDLQMQMGKEKWIFLI